jgi:tetratricopeptide (TPR) repeat protein
MKASEHRDRHQSSQAQYETWLKIGKNTIDEEDYIQASQAFENAVQIQPEDPDAWFSLAFCLGKLGRYEEAIRAIKKSIRINPHSGSSWYNLGLYFRHSRNLDEAIRSLTTALSYDANHIWSIKSLIDCYVEKKDPNSEIYYRKRLVSLPDALANEWEDLATAFRQNRRFAEEIDARKEVLRFGAGDDFSFLEMGNAYIALGKLLDAAECYKGALFHNSDVEEATRSLKRIEGILLDDADYIRRFEKDRIIPNTDANGYVNPYQLLNVGDVTEKELSPKSIQRLSKVVFQELNLEDGKLHWMGDVVFDPSQVHRILDELDDPEKRRFHLLIFQKKPLLDFLTQGRLFFFCYEPDLANYGDDDDKFIQFISPFFAVRYDRELFTAFRANEAKLVGALTRGRLLVSQEHIDNSYKSVHQYIDELAKIFAEVPEQFKVQEMPLARIVDKVNRVRPDLMNLLPSYFQDFQTRFARSIRSLAIDAFNIFGNAQLSYDLLKQIQRFQNINTSMKTQLHKDHDTITGKLLIEKLSDRLADSKTKKYSIEELERICKSDVDPILESMGEESLAGVHDDCTTLFRGVAIDNHNVHQDSQLALDILYSLFVHFPLSSIRVFDLLGEDIDKIKEIIKQKEQNDVSLTFGKKSFNFSHIKIVFGEKELTCEDIIGVRWGIVVNGNYDDVSHYDYYFEAKDDWDSIKLNWQGSPQSEKKQTGFFNEIIRACMYYIVPNLVDRQIDVMRTGSELAIGPCELSLKGISFRTQEVFFWGERFIAWEDIMFDKNSGRIQVRSRGNKKASIDLNPREVWNAGIMEFIAHSINENSD